MLRNCFFMLLGALLLLVGGMLSERVLPKAVSQWSNSSVNETILDRVICRQLVVVDDIKDARIDRIDYLLKWREEPQRISRQILDRIEERVGNHLSHLESPNLELLAPPVFLYRPLISPSEIYEFMSVHTLVPCAEAISDFSARKDMGGICYMQPRCLPDFCELNEYGIMY